MEPSVFFAVLAAAAMHAGWNAVVKVGLDRFMSVTLISLAAAVVSAAMLPFVSFPQSIAWPWLLVSAGLHTGYKLFLIQAYRSGDLGQVYPIARGAAPLLISIMSIALLGEQLGTVALAGIVVLVLGVWLMSIRGGRELAHLEKRAVWFALGTSVFIASYTLTDGIGARVNGTPHGYALWLFVLDGLLMLLVLLGSRGRNGLRQLLLYWKGGLAGGAMSLGSYWIAIWAMTLAPIALVAALRETSVMFAAAISILVLNEPLTRWRLLAGGLITSGVVLTRLG